MSPPNGSNFCSQCGASVSSTDAFCSSCGSAVGGGSGAGRVSDRTSKPGGFRRRIEDLTVEGWEVEHDYGDRVVMVDRGFGSWGIHALLIIFTGGLGNIPYAWYNYSPAADRIELRSDGTERYIPGKGSSKSADFDGDGSTLGTAGSVALSFFCALAGLAILSGVSSIPAFFVGVTFIATALFAFPPMRERLQDREAVTKFGRARSTDEKVVNAPDVPCTACSRPVEHGVKRTFNEKYFVAGVPLVTEEKGENCYCRACAQGDPFTEGTVSDSETENADETEWEF
ncbi:zinc-ribbon domain-containing protein [Halorussus amylolyticus]|uniref:zinc-ribbon domain-containing protein n=1 Tax=Halorussus amylolyticus TaxID=1126242 RepID=UPI001048102C|nr:zinc-ribbon domain-containing protein [Halorussus amylolyticus]